MFGSRTRELEERVDRLEEIIYLLNYEMMQLYRERMKEKDPDKVRSRIGLDIYRYQGIGNRWDITRLKEKYRGSQPIEY